MSQAEIKRFLADLNAKPALLSGLKAKAAGLASVVAYAAASGVINVNTYAVTAVVLT
jgi:hypothetical protein